MVSSVLTSIGAALVFTILPVSATALYTTGGVPPAYDPQSVDAWDILPSGIQAVAVEFNPSVTGTLGVIELPVAEVAGTGSIVVKLLTNSAGAPGSVIESWTPTVGTSVAMISLTSVLQPTLIHGTNYWVSLTTTGSLEANWYTNTALLRGADLFVGSWVSSSGSTKPAVAILSQTVPEPAAGALAAAGFLAAVALKLMKI
jgi:hypothetical protein